MNQSPDNNFQYLFFVLSLVIAVLFANSTIIPDNVALVVVLIIWLYYFLNDPVLAFMFAFTIFLNIALLFNDTSFGLPKYFKYNYLFFILTFLVTFSPKLKNIFIYRTDKINRFILIVILLFLYQVLVTIMINLHLNLAGAFTMMFKRFLQLFGILIFIPAYKVFYFDSKKYLK